jgi:D-alanyl-D-alanine dipeptidase
MGTPFDFFGKKAAIRNEQALVREGLLSQDQVDNRLLLRQVMLQAGFLTVGGEWWHFNGCSLREAKAKYRLIQ